MKSLIKRSLLLLVVLSGFPSKVEAATGYMFSLRITKASSSARYDEKSDYEKCSEMLASSWGRDALADHLAAKLAKEPSWGREIIMHPIKDNELAYEVIRSVRSDVRFVLYVAVGDEQGRQLDAIARSFGGPQRIFYSLEELFEGLGPECAES